MLDIAYRKDTLDQDTQRLDISRYLGMSGHDGAVRTSRLASRMAEDELTSAEND
ncbi:hypothetical protein ACLMAJ_15560 [Nocardia sp. KC 131]|uniref:hypothetical protein n=1 Tax=Nocardia arseniciresistens TaxID=3392119 RepID=UPI00398F02CA